MTNTFGFIAVIISLGIFITGKGDINLFFENIKLLNFLSTLAKTIIAYASGMIAISFSFLVIFDLIFLIFGFNFPIISFIYKIFVTKIIINWWWTYSLPENIFLSVIFLFFIMSLKIETKKRVITFFYDRNGEKINAVQIGLINQRGYKIEGISIGLINIRNKKNQSAILNNTLKFPG